MLMEISKNKLDKTDEIALHYGFNLAHFPESRMVGGKKEIFLAPEEKHHVLKKYADKLGGKNFEPMMIYYDKPILTHPENDINLKNYKIIGFDVLGMSGGVAEALIINTALKVLFEEGYRDVVLDINSTGDKSSFLKFTDELFNHYKKNSGTVESKCRSLLKRKDFFVKLDCEHKGCLSVAENSPRPINFLSENSRRHFKEVLEYLEEMNVAYRVNDALISPGNHYSKTFFEIKSGDVVLARGGRYDDVANKLIKRKNFSAVGVSMFFKKNGFNPAYSNKIFKPKIFLVQFGFSAKLKSFEVIDILRKNKVTVYQKLHKEKLSDQFVSARKLGVSYMIIIGQKEAVENHVIFRNLADVSSEFVSIDRIPFYLKKIGLV